MRIVPEYENMLHLLKKGHQNPPPNRMPNHRHISWHEKFDELHEIASFMVSYMRSELKYEYEIKAQDFDSKGVMEWMG